ncbi:polyamine ABC transporter substrate-binding protein [Spartinivicinus poritis]|uniref:Spermidine/putrescine ABC transporter substrate-binding protein n=1 Tax=Spartinivicinus poritis TaxID=2994640 RepID=A0ABT5U4D9_9GAMM|nr:spermidine/putrescine ABC transporter substrate-binding protein [Spartinivicinus sp. A2-2]MDE1461223.1 spermidine/putrescine ABC transporter substrate-binding protein [Spartinivicinus sp. A2-2]
MKFFILLACLTCTSFHSYANELILFNWQEYLSEKVVQQWQEQTGIALKQVYYDSDEMRDEILATQSSEQYDLVIIDSTSAQLFGKNNKLLPLTSTEVKNISNTERRWLRSCGNFGVPYFWGTTGIAYRADKVKSPPTSWQDLLAPSPELAGHIGMLEDYTDTLIPALRASGHPIYSENVDHLKAAYTLLKQQLPKVLTYDYIISYISAKPDDEELFMALAYSGDEYTLNDIVGKEVWKFAVPKEGTSLWVDCIAVLASSKNKQNALAFINFLNKPDIAALNANETGSATANKAAMPLIDTELKNDKSLYPSVEILDKSEPYRIISDKSMTQRNRIMRALSKDHETK